MKKASFSSFLYIVIILCSCEYQPSEVYNRKVNQNIAPPRIQAVELDIYTDTLYIYSNREVNFKFQSDNQEIRAVVYSIDGEDIGIVNSASGTFTLYTGRIKAGIHDLEIRVYTVAGTGSLADEMGMEAFVASKSWKLIMWDSYTPEMNKTIENGFLHIKWNEYNASNFKEYVVYKTGPQSEVTEIKRVKTNEFVDSTYVGEWANYSVRVITSDDNPFSTGTLSLDDNLPVLSYSVEDSNKYLVKWTKSKFYNAIDTFAIYQNPVTNFSSRFMAKATHDPNDTIYQVTNAGFGDELKLILRLVPKKTNINFVPKSYSLFESETWGITGLAFKNRDAYPYCLQVKNDEFVYYDCFGATRYSLSQQRAVEELTYESKGCYSCNFDDAQVSNTGKYLTLYVACNSDLLFTSGTALNSYYIHKLQNITNGIHNLIAVSDTGTAIIQNADGGFNLYDLATSANLGYYKKNYSGSNVKALKISSNGEYFFISADTLRLVHFKNNLFTDVWKQPNPNNIKFYEFDPVNPDRVIVWNGSRLSVNLCIDFSPVREIDLNDAGLLDIDYNNNEILTYSKGHLFVRSFTDGALIKDVPVNFNPMYWANACYLINHTIIYGIGFLYFVYPE